MENPEQIRVVKAESQDLDTVLEILRDAASWLLSKGIDQWRPESFSRETIAEKIKLGEVYLAKKNQQLVGTITLQWSDRFFWVDDDTDAGYVHKLAIKPSYTGKGLGQQLLEWAEQTTKAAGKNYLLLDCMFENPRIRRYYEDAGFTFRGEVRGVGWNAALYEKQL